MNKRQIVNIVNFIRAVEPREPVNLVTPVKEQIALMKKHNLRGTFLLQYDALIDPAFTDLLLPLDSAQFEMGVWFEIVQPQVEAAGLVWRGRFPWDWHAHCGFSVGYTRSEREKLVDVLYARFKEVFGYYPKVFGSWFYDSHTVRYIADKYGIDALCNCKEQYGTDGYTLWGGYYGQAYYPSRTNIFMPAQSAADQINAPLFRMLGSDPVYQYDCGTTPESGAPSRQGVITLEPVYKNAGGGSEKWVDWYLRENFNGDCLSFGYTQAGQENSFGWDAMKDGLGYQFALFEKLQAEGKLTVEPLGDSGRRYKATYQSTPPSAITAHTAYDDAEKSSVWYSSKYYRVNLYLDHGSFRIRDLHLFSPLLPDPFEAAVCKGNEATYETLPVADGNRHSGNGVLAGAYLTEADGRALNLGKMEFADLGGGRARVSYGDLQIELFEDRLILTYPREFTVENRIGKQDHIPTVEEWDSTKLSLSYQGTPYTLRAKQGSFLSPTVIASRSGRIELNLRNEA
ncbi:MAG: hypothetical protein IJX76_06150 [Clostridia bacterium]|nr:hypothetical protein [Clostridia bacterium]